jgi:hypothetical protein
MILAGTSLLYGVWFAYLAYGAFYVNHSEPLGAILLFVAEILFLPVVLLLWLAAFIVDYVTDIALERRKEKTKP